MKFERLLFCILSYFIIAVSGNENCYSQISSNTIIKGSVIDAETREPLPFVYVTLENTSTGTVTDISGVYNIVTTATSYTVKFSCIGYEKESRIITPGKTQIINIELKLSAVELNEVVVKPAKRNYSNKNNPAVDLIGKVIENKGLNRIEGQDYFKYTRYEKIVLSLSNLQEDFAQSKTFSILQSLLENVDTSRLDGRKNIPVYIKEAQSDFYYRKNPMSNKEIIKAEKTINFDEYIDNKGFSAKIKYLYQDIDIYDNEIFFLSNKFLSPVAASAPILYRYYILDTSMVENVRCIRMFFEPRNPADFLFHGFLFITSDSSYAIKKIDMSFNKGINIDWVNDVRIVQNFEKIQEHAWLLTKDEVSVDFGISQNMVGFLGQREVYYNNYAINEPIADTVFKGPEKITKLNDNSFLTGYWDTARLTPLTKSESALYNIVDSLRTVPAFRRRMEIVMLLTTQFVNFGKFEVGPVETFYSFNQIEGSRLRFGGRTTPEFSKRIYFDPYLAYGFNDKQFKYNLGITYSLSGRSIYQFPVKSVRLSYQYETETPGQLLQYAAKDNMFLSFKRGDDDKMLYNRTFSWEYLNELENHFSYALGYDFTKKAPAGNLYFTTSDGLPGTNEFEDIKVSEVYVKLRYAPKEEFYQSKVNRYPVPSKYPVINFQSNFGLKSLNCDYDYQKFTFSLSRRVYLSIVGYTDIAAEAGKIFGKVSYPLLFIHAANQTYSYQKTSYNMMNFLEFVSDQYFSLNVDHSFNGFFFNKVPLLKKLKLREVATFKMLSGKVSSTNDPNINADIFKFPTNIDGSPLTFTLEQKPYVEASIGLSNILRILRVDLIKRFTYLDNPNVSSVGFRMQIKMDI